MSSTFDRSRDELISNQLANLNKCMSKYAIIRFVLNEESGIFEAKVIAMDNHLHNIIDLMDDNDNVFQMH